MISNYIKFSKKWVLKFVLVFTPKIIILIYQGI
jgi:hypothetical protein